MKRSLFLGILLLFPLYAACGAKLTPAAAVADNATKAVQSAGLILKAAQAAHTQTSPIGSRPIVSTQQLDQIALLCDKLGRTGSVLSTTISDYQAAKAAGSDTAMLSAKIQTLVSDAMSVLSLVGTVVPSGTVSAIDQAVAQAFGFYAMIKASIL